MCRYRKAGLPGQALGYKIGMLKLRALRAEKERRISVKS